jgi:hypothetical protein
MANEADAESRDDNGLEPDLGATTKTPRWVKALGLAAVVVVALFVILQLTGLGGEHGPGRHTPGGGANTTVETPGGHTGPPSGVTHGER